MGGSSTPYAQIGSTLGHSANYFISRRAGADASKEMQDAQNKANALYTGLYDETKADYKPFQEGGQSAYADLLKSYGVGGQTQDMTGFYDSPDYQFALSQGQNALDRSAASRGRLYSGQQMKASQGYGQGLATQYLGNYRTGLGNLSNMGLSANNALAGYRQGYGNQLGQGYTNIGDIRAGEALGKAALHKQWVNSMDSTWGVGGGGGGGNSMGGGGQGQTNTSGLTQGLDFGGSKYGQYNWGGG